MKDAKIFYRTLIPFWYTCCGEDFVSRISYENSTMTDNVINKGGKSFRFEVKKIKSGGDFDILNDMSEYVTYFQFMNNLRNVSRAVKIYDVWIFDANYKRVLFFIR